MNNPNVYIEYETTNQSFLDMHYYLKSIGIQNNNFMLVLFDRDLAGIDIYDPRLNTIMKTKILREFLINPWFMYRNIRLPIQGGGSKGTRFRLDRGCMATIYMMILNTNIFVEMPRQRGKTTTVALYYLWAYQSSSNSELMLLHKNHDGSKDNLSKIKSFRDALPSYLRMDSPMSTIDGKKLKVPNRTEYIQHPINHNKIRTLPSAKNRQLANTLGRGCTQPLQWYDEFGWIVNNKYIYDSATPAFDTAAQNAKSNGAPYGITITTTPGDMTTEEGVYAYRIMNEATPFNESWYDFEYKALLSTIDANENSPFIHIRYTYQQLGLGDEYFKRMVKFLHKDWATIRREVMLEWSNVSDNNPFGKEDLDIIQQYCRVPIRTVLFGPYKQYQMYIYQDMNLQEGQIIGVDVSGGFRRDSSAITIINAKTTMVMATLNCNYMPTDDLANVIYELVSKYLPNALVCIEKNGVGIGVISRLLHTSIKKNLFYSIKDQVLEERTNGTTIYQNKRKVKVYGIDNTKEVRARMIELLFSRVEYHKDKFIAQILHDEMSGLTYKTSNGYTRVDHSVNTHDDQIFSYLMAIYVWYDCHDLTDRFGIHRGEIKTDDDIEDRMGTIESLYGEGYEDIKIDNDIIEEDSPLVDTYSILENLNNPIVTNRDLQRIEYENNERALYNIFKTPSGKNAIEKAYNIDLSSNTINSFTQNIEGSNIEIISSSYIDEWYNNDNIDNSNNIDNGNLNDIFSSIDIY